MLARLSELPVAPFWKIRMLESIQLPILVGALVVMSWAVVRLSSIRLNSKAKPSANATLPAEVVRWQADLKRLSQELQLELDEKMAAVAALSEAYVQASERLSDLILRAEEVGVELEEVVGEEEQRRMSA